MVHLVSRHETLRSTPGNFRQVTEKNRLYSVFFDFAVECGQSDFEQAGCFGLITFCIFQHTGDVATLHGRKFKTAGSGFIRLFVMGVLYIERQVGNIQPFTLANNQTALYHITQFPDITFSGLLFEGFEKSGCYFRNGTCQPNGEVLYKGFCQNTYIARPFTQGRQMNLEYGEPVE